MLIRLPGAPDRFEVRRIRNIADREPQRDTTGQLRSARTAYLMDPLEQLQVLRDLDERGGELFAIFHSHPDHDAYFSAMDRERAMLSGWLGPSYLVVSVVDGRACHARWFTWDPVRRDFCPEDAAAPARPAQELR